ncbi:hypothetical protein Q9Q99_05550 [Curtobacterium flaccumfaciens]|nr:hypothetical protein Q9Q99_05550 [Curtobacterium flaccumfaciens]
MTETTTDQSAIDAALETLAAAHATHRRPRLRRHAGPLRRRPVAGRGRCPARGRRC